MGLIGLQCAIVDQSHGAAQHIEYFNAHVLRFSEFKLKERCGIEGIRINT